MFLFQRIILFVICIAVAATISANAFISPTPLAVTGNFLGARRVDNEEIKTDSPQEASDCEPYFMSSSLSNNEVGRTKTTSVAKQEEGHTGGGSFWDKINDIELDIWTARGLLLLVAAIWGTNFASVKYLENLCFNPPCNHPPSEFAFARFGVAALVSVPLLVRQRWDVIRAGLECGFWIGLGYASQAVALADISSGKCAFICSLTVVFVPVISALLYGTKIKPNNVLAACLALTGVGVLEGMIDFNAILGIESAAADTTIASTTATTIASTTATYAFESTTDLVSSTTSIAGPFWQLAQSIGVSKGDLVALGQPLGFGLAFTRIEHHQETLKDVPNRVLTIAAAQCVMVGFLSFLWLLYDSNFTIPDMSFMIEPHRLAAIGWTGIVTTVFAIFLEGIALQTATATDASLAFSSEPVWASLFGLLLLNETMGMDSYIGGAIIMCACLAGAISDLIEEKENETP